MREWEIGSLMKYDFDMEKFAYDVSKQSMSEIVDIFESLRSTIDLCLSFSNIPEIAYILTDLQNVYGVEIANRFIYSELKKDSVLTKDCEEC